ncbi:MAG: 3-oxoacyl-ACP reductase FabG [Phycisphaerales bacterium]|nr:3-oxoacyl-ACP reductase FabG [Phycisphaerales bacterium]
MHADFDLTGRVALVTGSTTGLGRAMAFALAAHGARVVLNYANNVERATACFDEFKAAGYEGILSRGSVIDEAEVDRICSEAEAALGGIDIFVVNATPEQPQRPIEEYDWDFHQQMLDFFVKSPFLLTRRTLPHMRSQQWGRIINIGSEVFLRGTPNFSPYVAAKGAQNGWTRSMATELAPQGITVNMISPGWIPVERHSGAQPDQLENYRSTVPLGRMGVPTDLSGAVVFLASEASSFLTGQNLHVNGGTTTH